jgi:ABC-type multidrug transport system fused ATPase/permease subunit
MYWAFKIINIANKTEIKKEYLGQIGDAHDAKHFNNEVNYIWEDKGYKNLKKYALIFCIFRANIKMIFIVFFLTLIKAATNYFSIILIKTFIDYFDESADKSSFLYDLNLWGLGLLFLGSQILGGMLDIQNSMLQGIFGNKAQFQLCVFIYHKILKASQSSFTQRATEGQIINFVQFDAGKFNWMLIRSPSLLLHPIQIIAYSYLVYAFFGKAFIPGILVILIFCYIGYLTSRYYHHFQFKMLRKKDIRMKSTTEIFDNIKILKLYNWEKNFTKKILVNRKEEMDKMYYVLLDFIFTFFIFTACPCILSCLTLGLYQRNANISIGTMLIGLSLFQRLQEPINQLPSILSDFVEATVSLTRIEDYIKQPDVIESNIHKSEYDINSEYAIKIENGNFSWGVKQHEKKDKKGEKGEKGEKGVLNKNELEDSDLENKNEAIDENNLKGTKKGGKKGNKKGMKKDLEEEEGNTVPLKNESKKAGKDGKITSLKSGEKQHGKDGETLSNSKKRSSEGERNLLNQSAKLGKRNEKKILNDKFSSIKNRFNSGFKGDLFDSINIRDINPFHFDGLHLDISKYRNDYWGKNPFKGPSPYLKFYKERKIKIKEKIINMASGEIDDNFEIKLEDEKYVKDEKDKKEKNEKDDM